MRPSLKIGLRSELLATFPGFGFLEQDLGRGEAAAIALALELGLRRILIDEREGSRTAEQSGLEPVGVLGVLLRAKREGHLESVKEMMIALRDEVGFYIRRDLFAEILHLAGEG
jgi:predicted nucleic acid-binding protein